MKKSYPKMSIKLLGSVGSIINKSGTHLDCSMVFDTKSPDQGGGQEANCG